MIKAILFDLDGVVIVTKKRFSERASEEMGIPLEEILHFLMNEFRECSFGRADLKEVIKPFLIKWGYKGSVDNFLTYWFKSDVNTDKRVLEIVDSLRNKDIKCYIATRQEKYKKDYLLNEVGLKNNFDGIFCTCDIGYDKWQEEYWKYVIKELKIKPEEIMFFCDSKKNIESANAFGVNAYFYDGIDVLIDKTTAL